MIQGKPNILIVDDEESLRRNLQEFLEDEGFEVFAAGSGEEGLGILTNEPIDLAIVDIRLPGMDGNMFIKETHILAPLIKFLIFTGSVDYKLPDEISSFGTTEGDVFRKPLNNMNPLSERIKKRLETGAQE